MFDAIFVGCYICLMLQLFDASLVGSTSVTWLVPEQ